MTMARSFLVVGSGSIGMRHAKNLIDLGQSVNIYSYRKGMVQRFPSKEEVETADMADDICLDSYDGIIIANRTDQHIDIAIEAARKNKAIYIEKPLSNSVRRVQELIDICYANKVVVETGFMLRCHPNLAWIKSQLDAGVIGEIYSASSCVGQHLADWRPAVDYRQSYSAKEKFGGGVIFDLIHEIDLINWLFGTVSYLFAVTREAKCLEIETEALASILLKLETNVIANINLDYVRPSYKRTLEILGSDGCIYWDYVSGSVELERRGQRREVQHIVPRAFERNHMFVSIMERFLACVASKSLDTESNLNDGVQALKVALASHLSAKNKTVTHPRDIAIQTP